MEKPDFLPHRSARSRGFRGAARPRCCHCLQEACRKGGQSWHFASEQRQDAAHLRSGKELSPTDPIQDWVTRELTIRRNLQEIGPRTHMPPPCCLGTLVLPRISSACRLGNS